MVPDHDKDRDLCTYRRSLFYIEPQFEPTYRRDDESRDLREAVLKMAVRHSNRRQEKVPPMVAAGLCNGRGGAFSFRAAAALVE
jgi:hypothetical protein